MRTRLLLAALLAASLLARVAWLAEPCRGPCRTSADRALVFDETYYVNAARRIAGVSVTGMEHYAGTPAGQDPNSEHPQLVKLLMAGGIELFGDGPLAWRLPALLLGTLALVGIFALTRAAGGSERLALGAAALAAADNLLLVHGRIGTLDVPVLAAMVWGVTAYLRGRTLMAGVILGIGACSKLVAPYALSALALFELLSVRNRGDLSVGGLARAAAGRLSGTLLMGVATFAGGLALLDGIAPPFDPVRHAQVTGGALGHLTHMLDFAARQISPHGPQGIASEPWMWWADLKSIVYLNVNTGHPSTGLTGLHPDVHFLGAINPAILFLALPGLLFSGQRLWRSQGSRVDALAWAWCLGVWGPFLLAGVLLQRTSYLYYMVVVMPGIILAVAGLTARARTSAWRWLRRAWIAAVLAGLVIMYPFTPLPS